MHRICLPEQEKQGMMENARPMIKYSCRRIRLQGDDPEMISRAVCWAATTPKRGGLFQLMKPRLYYRAVFRNVSHQVYLVELGQTGQQSGGHGNADTPADIAQQVKHTSGIAHLHLRDIGQCAAEIIWTPT
jgi:hypothetical protein